MPLTPYLRDAAGNGLSRLAQQAQQFSRHGLWGWLDRLGRNTRAHDDMTGVLTGAEFRRRVRARWDQCPGAAVLLFDVDHLAHVNHAVSIQAADACLVAMACIITTEAEGAWVGRLGGDEFAIYFEDVARAVRSADRVRASVEQSFRTERTRVIAEFPELAAHPVLTFSVGAVRVLPGRTLMQVLELGEQALSAAKLAGRNRLCWAP